MSMRSMPGRSRIETSGICWAASEAADEGREGTGGEGKWVSFSSGMVEGSELDAGKDEALVVRVCLEATLEGKERVLECVS